MSSLEKLPQLKKEDIGLLQDAGIRTRSHLARFTGESLGDFLHKNRAILNSPPPNIQTLETWVDCAINYKQAPEENTTTPLAKALSAKLVDPENLKKANISLEELPLSLAVTDSPIHTKDNSKYTLQSGAAINTGPTNPNNRKQGRRIEKELENTGIDLRRTPRPDRNKGLSHSDPRYLRGLLHARPAVMYTAAWLILSLYFFLPLFILSFIAIPLGVFLGLYERVPFWLFIGPLLFLFSAILNLFVLSKATCTVCGQPEFLPRQCQRHARAHRSRFGHSVATAKNLIRYHWFRCQFCGTSIRTKE